MAQEEMQFENDLTRVIFSPSLYFQRAVVAISAQPNASLELTCGIRAGSLTSDSAGNNDE
jgi:hypothetical protein